MGVGISARFAETVINHWQEGQCFFEHSIPTGPLEELSNKIKLLKRQA